MAEFEQIKVMIDPGHGGEDFGAIGEIKNEKSLNLSFAKILYDAFIMDYRFLPFMTRDTDEYVRLSTRVKKAVDKDVDFFVSIHANSFTSEDPNGLQVYYYNEQKDRPFADTLYSSLKGLHGNKPSKWAGVRHGNYYVLRKLTDTDIPAVLIETGFISNSGDEYRLADSEFQMNFANAVYNTFRKYI